MAERTCSIESCERKHDARGYCNTHYLRFRRTGTTDKREVSAHWRGDHVTYAGAHMRLRAVRGPASGHPCIACGAAQSDDWAYRKDASKSIESPTGQSAGLLYSPDPEDYQPMCRGCHRAYDKE